MGRSATLLDSCASWQLRGIIYPLVGTFAKAAPGLLHTCLRRPDEDSQELMPQSCLFFLKTKEEGNCRETLN
jgi:hypothetical protein